VGFFLAALVAAIAAATIADGYGKSVVRGYGELRPVVVAVAELEAGREIDPEAIAEKLEVRRVPVRFAPPAALATPAEALGLSPVAAVSAGSYLLRDQLQAGSRNRGGVTLGRGRRPVEIVVGGAGALSALGTQPVGSRVDVVVTTEPDSSGDGRTYVAAPGVTLLAVGPGGEGGAGEATVTLALTRGQALRLIAAESFARKLTVIPAA
jgi:Flp pilus assembly protein CpaB